MTTLTTGGAVTKQYNFFLFLILYFAPGLNDDITTLCKHQKVKCFFVFFCMA